MKKKIWIIIGLIIVISIVYFITRNGDEHKNNEIIIGAILPLTGSSAQYGQWIKDALEMAKDEVNNEGGINGEKLIIKYEDDKGDPTTTANAMEKLSTIDKVPVVFGSFNSGSVLSQAPVAEKNKTPILTEAQSPRIRDAGDYVFRIQPDSRLYMKYFIPYIYNDLKIRSIAILYINNAFGNDITDIFTSEYEKIGGKIIYKEAFQQGSTDFKTQLSKIKQTNPEGIFVPAVGEIGNILKQAYEMDIKIRILGNAPTESPEVLQTAGKGADGVIYCHHFNSESTDSITLNFVKKYKGLYNRDVEGYAALAYDGLKVIAYILKNCGSDKECIKEALYKTQNFPGVTGLTSFDQYGDVIKPIYIKTIMNGKFITLWKSK